MNIIKLSAINSTNDYLKQLSAVQYVENFTIVTADNQTAGRGQMGAKWNVEPGKNLTFSVLIKDLLLQINEIFSLNAAVAVSVADALETLHIGDISIKWPNDILAGNKKIGGILIENSIKNNGEIYSVVGIGLNVNQQFFDGLSKATSLALLYGREYDRETVMLAIAENLKRNVAQCFIKIQMPFGRNTIKSFIKRMFLCLLKKRVKGLWELLKAYLKMELLWYSWKMIQSQSMELKKYSFCIRTENKITFKL